MSDQRYPPLRPQSPLRAPRRQSLPWPMISGVVLLAILVTVLAVVLLGGNGDGAATGTSSPSPSTSASVTTAGSPSAAPSASAAPGAFAADAVVGTTVDALTLRAGPALGAEPQWRLPAGTLGFVIGGPVDADGFRWYQLSGMGLPYASGCVTPEPGEMLTCPAFLGWVAANAEDGTPWLEAAAAPECPPAPHTVISLSERQYTTRLICFDAEPITFVAWWPPLPEDPGLVLACPAAETEIGWLVCQDTNTNVLVADPSEPSGAGGRWPISIDPSSGVGMPERGQWLEMTGHFDDPAAQRCGEVAEPMGADAGSLVFRCRLQFVVSAVAVSAGP